MNPDDHCFLFSSFDDKKPLSTRKIHLRRLNDVLQLSLHRGDLPRARRAWSILARCKEVDWKAMWTTGVYLLVQNANSTQTSPQKIEFLRTMMLQCPDQQELILCELVFHYILAERYKDALDELEFYLPSFPYHENPVLYVYAGLLSIYLAQPPVYAVVPAHIDQGNGFDSDMLSRAQIFLERAKALDMDNIVANTFLNKLHSFSQGPAWQPETTHDSDEETLDNDVEPSQPKRARTDHLPV
ncbi:hypothetical protein BV22DRAFT_1101649 [Leucogyrophana mollusca]|uniref:Uncharacterized protein n=1 Tax=Leucogyrophana mollusca TaxID=85980 RepID=A0ACB8BYY7_9AGAM|nr:hypothetical protein BV22DRAFT_1101649 [Leucogyrophana mollusca]